MEGQSAVGNFSFQVLLWTVKRNFNYLWFYKFHIFSNAFYPPPLPPPPLGFIHHPHFFIWGILKYRIMLLINMAPFTKIETEEKVKEGLQTVLRIGSAHNKGGPPNINIAQISHFSNSF